MSAEKTILVVEDDFAIRRDLEALLSLEGFAVVSVANGEAALRALADASPLPALVLLDIMMPVMDGWKFREAQIQVPAFASIPVVVMTAGGQARESAQKMNAQGYIPKPIDADRLLEIVARLAA